MFYCAPDTKKKKEEEEEGKEEKKKDVSSFTALHTWSCSLNPHVTNSKARVLPTTHSAIWLSSKSEGISSRLGVASHQKHH